MTIKLYNTLGRKKEAFRPIEKGHVKMYSCGPTVYDTPHLGNYRTFVMSDILRRVFEYNNLNVDHVMNITDVDDKTIKRSREENILLKTLTEKYESLFIEGLQSLNIIEPKLIRATDNIQFMVELIQTLIDKGVAYKADDGVYMSISKVKNYGALAALHFDVKDERARINNDEYDKENPIDFALWKFKSDQDGDVSWPAPFGEGRPGWHIECSAMAIKELGETLDVHTGGTDLIFPHHTNEIAQSESATGKTFANYWLHGGFMTIKEEKMAKSKGNVIKLEDLKENTISPLAYRYWLLTAHYRSLIDFSVDAVKASQTALIRLLNLISAYPEGGKIIKSYKDKFTDLVNDDMDMPKAVALIWDLIRDQDASDADKRATIIDFDRVLGLNIADVKKIVENIPAEITVLAEAREQAREAKDWKKADALRQEILNRGYEINDTDKGFEISTSGL